MGERCDVSINRGSAWGWVAYYRGQAGQWAWVLHRVSGIAVALFLLIHIIDTFAFGFGPEVYDALLALWAEPVFLALQVPLYAAVVYHALNGIRVTIIDFWGPGSLYQERLFWAELVLFFVLVIPGSIIMLSPVFR